MDCIFAWAGRITVFFEGHPGAEFRSTTGIVNLSGSARRPQQLKIKFK